MSGAGVCIALGAAVAPIIATYICTRTMPNGFSKAINDPHNKVNVSNTFIEDMNRNGLCYDYLPEDWSKNPPRGMMYTSVMPPSGYAWAYITDGKREKAKLKCN